MHQVDDDAGFPEDIQHLRWRLGRCQQARRTGSQLRSVNRSVLGSRFQNHQRGRGRRQGRLRGAEEVANDTHVVAGLEGSRVTPIGVTHVDATHVCLLPHVHGAVASGVNGT
jgi:hypothetical protein